jgi:uncharacterized protein with HEPN domain
MRPSLPSYLLDLQAAIADIREYTNAKTLTNYLSDSMMRAAVERKLTVIGEVLAQVRYHFPESLERIDNARQIIDFRNLLMHQYLDVDDTIVWGIVEGSLGTLEKDIERSIAEQA